MSKSNQEGSIQIDEKELIRSFRELSPTQKTKFLSKILKAYKSIEGLVLPYSIDIFNESVQLLFSLLSQILGHDNDK